MTRFGPGFGYGFHHGPGVFGWFFLAVLLALLVLGVVALVRLWTQPHGRLSHFRLGPPPPVPPVDPAMTELRLRYARGELSREEYLQRAVDLGYAAPPGASGASGAPGAPGAPPGPPSA